MFGKCQDVLERPAAECRVAGEEPWAEFFRWPPEATASSSFPHDMKPQETFDLSFRVAVYHEGGEWVAHALEADIVGCGGTPEEALKELHDSIECQVSFALQTGDLSLIQHEAPREIVTMWEEVNRRAMEAMFSLPRPARKDRPAKGRRSASAGKEAPQAKFLGLTGSRLEALRKTPLEPVNCG